MKATAHHIVFSIGQSQRYVLYILRKAPEVHTGQVPCDGTEACGIVLEDSGGWNEPNLLQLSSPGFWEYFLTHSIQQAVYRCCLRAIVETHPA